MNFKLKLKQTFSIFFGFQLILIIILGILIFFLYQNQKNLAKSRDHKYQSYQLADQLRQSSDDLTRLVRTYVATGNPEFEREYWAVLDIRNGKIPRPLDYDNIYWDFVSATGQKPRPDGEAISLQDLMIKEGFTEDEFAKLSLAQKNSDNLVHAEIIAINAMKGLFEDSQGNFTIINNPDQKFASDLVNNETYHQTKAEIMQPIDDFYIMFEGRTDQSVAKYLQISNILFLITIGLSIFIFIISFNSFFLVKHQISDKEKAENNLNELSKNLEQQVKDRTEKIEKSGVLLKKTLAESEKLNQHMVNRELKMIELKQKIKDLEKANHET